MIFKKKYKFEVVVDEQLNDTIAINGTRLDAGELLYLREAVLRLNYYKTKPGLEDDLVSGETKVPSKAGEYILSYAAISDFISAELNGKKYYAKFGIEYSPAWDFDEKPKEEE
jgi:hypothetical protein